MLGMDQDHDLHITLPDVLLRISDILKPQNFFPEGSKWYFQRKAVFFFLIGKCEEMYEKSRCHLARGEG